MRIDPSVRTPTAMVSSVDPLATQAGLAILGAGGNAVDAAIATSAVLAVTTPHMCGMGGDLFALLHRGGTDPPECLTAVGRAGSGADPDRLRSEGLVGMPFRDHICSVPVPGCVDGWLGLHERFGSLPLAELLVPAITYAELGFPASPLLALMVGAIREVRGADELMASAAGPGTRITRSGVARTLRAIVDRGRDGFYGGEFGEGLLTLGVGEFLPDDLTHRLDEWSSPLHVRVHDHDVWTPPAPSQGYLTLLGLAIAAKLDLPDDPGVGTWAHLLVESARAAGYDRLDQLHDGADVGRLLKANEIGRRRDLVDPDQRTPRPAPTQGGGTIHLCTADAAGGAVSLIQSNASGFGAHLAVGTTGILLHNRGLGFNLIAGHPAEYAPGRRPPHTLSPAMVTRPDGSLHAAVGTMGGDSQPQILLQVLTRLLRHSQPPGLAIPAKRWVLAAADSDGFNTWRDLDSQVVLVEPGSHGWIDGLAEFGHEVRALPFGAGFGHAHAIVAEESGWSAMADPRAVIAAAAGF